MKVLLVDSARLMAPDAVEYLTAAGYVVDCSSRYDQALARTQAWEYDAVVLPAPAETSASDQEAFREMLRAVDTYGMAAIVLGPTAPPAEWSENRLVDYSNSALSKEELRGRLATILRYHRVVRAMERDVDNMQRLFKRLNVQFNEVDQEMRLAGRLQSNFLPRNLDTLGPARFSALYRPASFVSGDIYDVFRVDEQHVGFYVADAVGHGMAASLLTMFIKTAIVAKRVYDDHYVVLQPGETLGLLNARLQEQKLPHCQFVTACYGLLNLATLELRYARAGHPYPLLLDGQGQLSDLKSPGGLLGLFEGEDYPTQRINLKPGEKVVLLSDGVETAFAGLTDNREDLQRYRDLLRELGHLSADRLIAELSRRLDEQSGSLNPQDDITLLVLEVG